MATIVLTAQAVIDAATNTIAKIKAERKARNAETVKRVMRLQFDFSWRRGFFRMNEQEAAKWLQNQSPFSSWGVSWYGYDELEASKKLLKLAQHGDPVTLNENDVAVIF